jgi:hypothetical protein
MLWDGYQVNSGFHNTVSYPLLRSFQCFNARGDRLFVETLIDVSNIQNWVQSRHEMGFAANVRNWVVSGKSAVSSNHL